MLQFDISNALPFLPYNWLTSCLDGLNNARASLETGRGLGGAFTGWVRLPEQYDQEELNRILDKLRKSGYGSLSDDEKRRLFDQSK